MNNPLQYETGMPRCCRLLLQLMTLMTALLLVGVGCSQQRLPVYAEAQAIADIKAQSKRFSQAYMDGDIAGLTAIYTPAGIAAPGGRDFIQGHSALQRFWQLPPGRTILRHSAQSQQIIVNDDYAYDWGYYQGQAAQHGAPLPPFQGKYVIIWQRTGQGDWRMAMDMWNALPAD